MGKLSRRIIMADGRTGEPKNDVVEASMSSASSTAGANTPTQSTFSESYEEISGYPHISHSHDIPWPGSAYVIRSCLERRVLTLAHGCLELKDQPVHAGGWKWECVEKDGWLGFRNTVSGTYLGHDGAGTFRATALRHAAWEYLGMRKCPEGGYLLLTVHGWKLRKMDTAKGSNTLVETEMIRSRSGIDGIIREGGSLWEFVKV
ncbi:hypothetical protein HYALB_00002104 [Hymenoscyphus albidus]|uniref:Uncharacterized protein n=1 Tax=Hymenoscyphus albidus TaxID=595503 RepID=A0A9N9Q7D8_9HELO|nr:hypothetical protein HYALB_00002104 [Hymenoscyphus albidus]